LPKAARDETLIQTLESRVAALSGYTALQAGLTLPEILNSLGDMELVILQKPSWCVFTVVARLTEYCFKDAGEAELQDMIEKMMVLRRPAIFCEKVYQASSDELAQLIVDLRAES